jgi:hypothetical protein
MGDALTQPSHISSDFEFFEAGFRDARTPAGFLLSNSL